MNKSQKRIEERVQELAQFTATPGQGVTRLTYSKEDLLARNYIKEKMRDLDLEVKEDGFGNIFGKMAGSEADAPSVMIGSHFDSVPNGGAYDGTAGVVAALEVAELFRENKLVPKYPLEVIAMIEEEGTRFKGGLMGSRGMTGSLSPEEFRQMKDDDGIFAEEAMASIGLDPSLPKKRNPETIKAFMELHIEQGPVLEEKNLPIGIVDAIVGLSQLEVVVEGQAGHAGTTPMNRRADALVAAAGMISAFPAIALEIGGGTVITTGRLNVFPNGANVIPDKVVFTVDIRSGKEKEVMCAIARVKEAVTTYQQGGIKISIDEQLYIEPKEMDENIRALFQKTSEEAGIPFVSLNSGAGHDAMVLSDVTATGMIFVPSKDGLSHCPEEWSDSGDLAKGVKILYEAAKELTEADSDDQ